MAILIVRHGETPSNRARIVQTPETPLSTRGVAQAERLADRLSDQPVIRIVSSDLTRARMTAERIVAQTGAPLHLDPLLQERNFGEIRGTAYADLDVDPMSEGFAPPGGETWQAFHARVDAAWESIRARIPRGDGHLVVVTHGLVCYSLAARHLALAPEHEPELGFGNTALTIAEDAPPYRVTLFNCVAHLGEAGGDPAGGAV